MYGYINLCRLFYARMKRHVGVIVDTFPLGRPASVGEVVDLIVLLASPRSAYTSGAVFSVDGGLSAHHAP